MSLSRLLILSLALSATACSSTDEPSEDVIRAAADAAREAVSEDLASGAYSRIVALPPMKPCSVSIANGEPHGHLAHSVLQEATLAVEATEGLSISEQANEDLTLLLVRTQRADPRSRVWDRPPSLTSALGEFYVAYVILGEDGRYLDGHLIKCEREYKQCGERMATHTLRI